MSPKAIPRLFVWSGLAVGMCGCAPILATQGYVHIDRATQVPLKKIDKGDASAVRAASKEVSKTSGRARFVVEAKIADYSGKKVAIDLWISSTESWRLDTDQYYIWLSAGKGATQVKNESPGKVKNAPFRYTYQLTEEVEIGRAVHDWGGETKYYAKRTREVKAKEDYFTQKTRLTFSGPDLAKKAPKNVRLQLRDAGVNVNLRWKVKTGGGGGDAKPNDGDRKR